jgi:hypothetical protein
MDGTAAPAVLALALTDGSKGEEGMRGAARREGTKTSGTSQLEKGGNVYCGLRNRSGAKDKSALAITNSTMFMSLGLV